TRSAALVSPFLQSLSIRARLSETGRDSFNKLVQYATRYLAWRQLQLSQFLAPFTISPSPAGALQIPKANGLTNVVQFRHSFEIPENLAGHSILSLQTLLCVLLAGLHSFSMVQS